MAVWVWRFERLNRVVCCVLCVVCCVLCVVRRWNVSVRRQHSKLQTPPTHRTPHTAHSSQHTTHNTHRGQKSTYVRTYGRRNPMRLEMGNGTQHKWTSVSPRKFKKNYLHLWARSFSMIFNFKYSSQEESIQFIITNQTSNWWRDALCTLISFSTSWKAPCRRCDLNQITYIIDNS